MASHSSIEWTDATWQPITGCSVVSPGCTNCYAMRLAGTRLQHHPSRAGLTTMTKAGPVWNGAVRFNREWLTQPLGRKKPKLIFVCAHGDLFHESVPDEWIDQVFAVMALAPQHTFQVLTKRAERMRKYMERMRSRWILDLSAAINAIGNNAIRVADAPGRPAPQWPLPNVWLGVSAEDQRRADERIPHLLATPAAVRFVSAEPLLGPIDLTALKLEGVTSPFNALQHGSTYTPNAVLNGVKTTKRFYHTSGQPTLDWVIVGGESGPSARPMHPDWARSIRDQCAAAGVAFFFKQWGAWKNGSDFADDAKVVCRDGRVFENTIGAAVDADSARPIMAHNPTLMRNVGKKRAGRLLDGVEHNGVPAAAHVAGGAT